MRGVIDIENYNINEILTTDNTGNVPPNFINDSTGNTGIIPNQTKWTWNGNQFLKIGHENKKLGAFNVLMFNNVNEYQTEKDMPDDIFMKYCTFCNKIEGYGE